VKKLNYKEDMMKRLCVLATIFLLILAVAGTAFAMDITIAAGGTSGSWFISGSAFQDAFSQNIKGTQFSVVPGGGAANPIRVDSGDAQVGFTYATNAKAAAVGKPPYKKKASNLRALVNLQILQYLMVTAKKSLEINSFDQWFKDKAELKVLPGPRSMGGWMTLQRVFEEYGTSKKEIKGWGSNFIHAGWSESSQQLLDGHADIIAPQAPLKWPVMVDLANSRDLKFFDIDQKVRQALKDKYGYVVADMPAGTYKGQDAALKTMADSVVLLVNKDVPDDLAYQMVKIICENKDRWVATHAMFKPFDPKNAANVSIDLHPGAAKYFKEKGYIK
jgi:TRAP transporter TAXI family solute receptor